MDIQKKNYKLWKTTVNKYIKKILHKDSDEINDIDYRYYFNLNYDPYLVSILSILQSREFLDGLIYESFIIPFKNKTILVKLKNII